MLGINGFLLGLVDWGFCGYREGFVEGIVGLKRDDVGASTWLIQVCGGKV